VGIFTHFLAVDFPGPSVKLEQSGIDIIPGKGIEGGFTEGNVANDVGVHAVLPAVLLGKAGLGGDNARSVAATVTDRGGFEECCGRIADLSVAVANALAAKTDSSLIEISKVP